MTDRKLLQLSPRTGTNAPPVCLSFTSLEPTRNIVLLGDPGAGKTHLFKSGAKAVGGRYMTVRTFLNVPAIWGETTLFLDALDEKRSGRGDDSVVDAIVQKLFVCPPAKLRISCRAQDWLGESDLEAFGSYFHENDGVTVVSLSALTEPEQRNVLNEHGFRDIDGFLAEASERGLSEFLNNPQDLMMLATAVADGKWPSTRLELFNESTRLWLAEQNREHSRRDNYSAEVLRSAAGALCALRLISDIEGFALEHHGLDDAHPGTGQIPFLEPPIVQAALQRRVFTAIPGIAAVDYTHRTTAEYLAAEWLASQLDKGLSFRRLSALLGHDGHPATELRGLHAWLAVLAPRFAEQLTNTDPYGVLSYGDPAALSPSLRVSLLNALSNLSIRDPWFRYGDGNRRTDRLTGMCGPEMTAMYQSILRSQEPNRTMRLLVLEALSAGSPNPELTGDIAAIVADEHALLAERETALRALLKLGHNGQDAALSVYRHDLQWDASALQIRAEAISQAYGTLFDTSDVIELLEAIEDCEEELKRRLYLWHVSDAVPSKDIPTVLNGVRVRTIDEDSNESQSHNESTASHLLSSMLVKLLGSDYPIAPPSLWNWLNKLTDHRASPTAYSSLKKALLARKDLVLATVSEGLLLLPADTSSYQLLQRLQAITAGAVGIPEFLDTFLTFLESAPPEGTGVPVIYELALWLTFSHAFERPSLFECLYILGERGNLRQVRDSLLVVEIPEWRLADARRRHEQQIKQLADREKLIASYSKHESAIRAGSASGWLGWLAQVYLGRFSDVDHSLAPIERLSEYLGANYVESAVTGLIATLDRADAPDVRTIAETSMRGTFPTWWLAIIAGLDVKWNTHPEIADLSDQLISAALTIDLTHPTSERDGNTSRRKTFAWKTEAFADRPDLARDVYLLVAKIGLDARWQNVEGLGELLSMDEFAWCRAAVALSILKDYPNAPSHHLSRMLEVVTNDSRSRENFVTLARVYLSETALESPSYPNWLVAAFTYRPDEFQAIFFERIRDDPTVLWTLRDALQGMGERGHITEDRTLHASILERIVLTAAGYFPETPHPANGWSGDRNPWDGAEFVKKLLNMIALQTTAEATLALDRLASNEALATYRDYLLHATAEQRTRRQDAEYQQPDWAQTVTTLTNGAPANIADFHALLVDTLLDVGDRIANANNNIYKRFWNESSFGKILDPKPEESGRDVLIDLLRERLGTKGISVEPEGRMVDGKRADIVSLSQTLKIPVEIKRNYHADVWRAPISQLDRLYTRDPDASGYGIYTVFWFGNVDGRPMPRHPEGRTAPCSASEMAVQLTKLLPEQRRLQISIVVIDVSGQLPPVPNNRSEQLVP